MSNPSDKRTDIAAAKEVSVAAKEVNVVGENVHVEGQDETTKQKDKADVANLAARAVDVEDKKKANAAYDVAQMDREERKRDADERRETRIQDADTAKDVRGKEFRKTILVIILAAIPPTLVGTAGVIVAYRDSAINLSTHKLVNSGSLVQLKINLRSARKIYMLTQDPEDKKDLYDAEQMVEEHIRKQKLADEAHK